MTSEKKHGILYRIFSTYVHVMSTISTSVGKFARYLVLLMMVILLIETSARLFFNASQIWAVETAQFVMAAYYMLGGAYILIIGGHVRMDLFFHRWSPRNQALSDVITFAVALLYILVLWYGAFTGLVYAIEFKQVSYSAWAPSMIPIKIFMVIGITIMVLQMIAEFIRSLSILVKREIQ